MKHPVTPDGRYFVVRGRLWRMANPDLDENERSKLVSRLMSARRAVRQAKADADTAAEASAHRAVDRAKRALGERGPVWKGRRRGPQPSHGKEHALRRMVRRRFTVAQVIQCPAS